MGLVNSYSFGNSRHLKHCTISLVCGIWNHVGAYKISNCVVTKQYLSY